MTWRESVAVAAICIGTLIGSARQSPLPLVTIDSGTLRGKTAATLPDGGAFLGIPFAAQPVGALRWRAPQLALRWAGIRAATQWGPACPQRPSPWLPEMLGVEKMPTDEACLYLNVWTPELHPGKLLPVFVWVHGGGNVEGSGEWPPLGETLAQQGIVVVSFNYRLGAFGFYAGEGLDGESAEDVSGNYGHLDQLAALAWVQRNIGQFGGDAAQVTIGGESSGALDVCNLMASPRSAGLFRAAILESGVCVDSVYPTLHEAEQNNQLLAKDLGVSAGPDALARLRSLPAEQVLDAAAQDDDLDLEPNVDGWVFQRQPAITFAKGEQTRVPVLLGSNEDEITIFASPIVGGKSNRPTTVAAYREWLRRRFGTLADRVFAAYPAAADGDVSREFVRMDTDFDFGFGAWLQAKEMAATRQRAWLYQFTYVGAGPFAALGAFHSEELMFLSGHYWTSWPSRPEDAALSRDLIGYWVQFVKTGDPNGTGLPQWPDFARDGQCQELGRHVGAEAVPGMEKFGVFQEYLTARLRKAGD